MDNRLSKSQLLLYIQQLQLICLDLVLYLDTHPEDEKAHECFHEYNCTLCEAVAEYEKCYGPLMSNSTACRQDEVWLWAEQPWPWEIKKGGCR